MIGAGASPKAVQVVLGHRSAAFALTVYGHLFDADLDDLALRLDGEPGSGPEISAALSRPGATVPLPDSGSGTPKVVATSNFARGLGRDRTCDQGIMSPPL